MAKKNITDNADYNNPFAGDDHPWNQLTDDGQPSGDSSHPEDEEESWVNPLSVRLDDAERVMSFTKRPPAREAAQPPIPEPVFKDIPEDKGFTVSALVEAAMMIALSVVLAVVGVYVPVLNLIGQLFYPLPIIVLCLRRGMRVGIVAAVALFTISVILLGLPVASQMLVQYGVLGVFLGYCFRKMRPPLFTLSVSIVIAACGTMLGLLLANFVAGLPLGAILTSMNDSLMLFIESSGPSLESLLEAQGTTIEQYTEQMLDLLPRLLPGVMILFAGALTAITYIITGKVLRRLKYKVPTLPPFALWRVDWRFGWVIILGIALRFAGHQFGWQIVSDIGINILYVVCPLMAVVGLGCGVWLFKNIFDQMWIKALCVILLIAQTMLMLYVLVFLAVLDGLYDIRKLAAERKERRKQRDAKR